MSTIIKVLHVGTALAVSAGILACTPKQNANLLPSNTIQKTQMAEVSVPLEVVTFADENLIVPNSKPESIVAEAADTADVTGTENVTKIAKVAQPRVKVTNLKQPELVAEPIGKAVTEPVGELASSQQKIAYNFYGTPDQPGYQIQVAIFELFEQGVPLDQAAQQIIALVIDQNQVIRDALAMAAVTEQPDLSVAFVYDISQLTALIDATKRTMEEHPGQLSSIISLGVTLYPDYTRDIIAAAALTGEMTEEDAILVAVAAGADPTLLASSTAAGTDGPGLSPFSATPLGSGVGAGGTGGGDTTASTN